MVNQSLVRYVNERRILTLLRVEAPSTRAKIARRLSLTRSTITHLVDDLLERKLLREMAPEDSGARRELGRPGINVSLNPSGAYFVGAEIDVGVVRFAVLDLAGKVAETEVIRGVLKRPQDAVRHITRFLDSLEQKKKFRGQIRGLGVTVPGLVRSDGLIVHLPVLGWKNVNFLEQATAKTRIPVFIENNTNAAAFGEIYTFPRPDRDFIIYLKLGIGCGGAAIMNGRLMRGSSGTAAEFGHLRVAKSGPVCTCGRRGCLESYVNLAALARAYAPGASLSDSEISALSGKVVAAAAAGEAKAEEVLDSIAEYLIMGLIGLTNIFNPSEIVLGGIMRPILADRLEQLRRGVRAGIMPGMSMPSFSLSAAGEFECAIGAAAIAHHESFDVSNIELEVIESDPQRHLRAG